MVLPQRGESQTLQVVALMQQGAVGDLTAEIAILTARESIECRLPIADSIILATSRVHGAAMWTEDSNFEEIKGVQHIARRSA